MNQQKQQIQQPQEPETPLSVVLAEARKEMMKATNGIMIKFGIPACVMDGMVSSILADIRAQSTAELIRDLQQSPEMISEAKEGDKNE